MVRLSFALAISLLLANGFAVAAESAPAASVAPPTAVTVDALAAAKPRFEKLGLKSKSFIIVDQDSGELLAAKNADTVVPVASLTKVMTAIVVLDADQSLDELLEITSDDVDTYKRTPSRLKVGTRLSREDLLLLALMASENRAALTLSRHYPGGRHAFIAQMNKKARALGMKSTRFADPAGLSSLSVSSARDLHILVTAAAEYPLIRAYSTREQHTVRVGRQRVSFVNSNRLVRRAGAWDIELQKTGFTNEAGRCLLMQTKVANRRLAMVFLDSFGTLTRYADAARVRRQLEIGHGKKSQAKKPQIKKAQVKKVSTKG